MTTLAASAIAPQRRASPQDAAVVFVDFARMRVQGAKRVHDIVKSHWPASVRRAAQRRSGFDRTRIGSFLYRKPFPGDPLACAGPACQIRTGPYNFCSWFAGLQSRTKASLKTTSSTG
jgi:hypothetical protein